MQYAVHSYSSACPLLRALPAQTLVLPGNQLDPGTDVAARRV